MIFLLFLCAFGLFSQEALKGTALCDTMFSFLQKKGFNPQVQPLASGGINTLPYNIIVTFAPENTKTTDNFILIMDINDSWNHKEQLELILKNLSESPLLSQTVFCYYSESPIPIEDIIYGADIFAQSLNTNQNNYAYIFNLSARKNNITAGTNGICSPSWMLKDMYNAYSKSKITDGLPLSYISQTADYASSTDRNIIALQQADIPCILGSIKDSSKAPEVIQDCVNSFCSIQNHQRDSHSFMFWFLGQRIWLSEYKIVNTIIIFILLSFFLVFGVGFVNRTLRKGLWQEIKEIWYVIPLIYVLTIAGFYAGKGLYRLFVHSSSNNYTSFGFIILQISISMIFVSAFYMLNLSFQKKYNTRSLDFMLVIDTFINLVIFTLADISLFPIFMLIFLVSIISIIFRRNWIHIVLFVFLILPFIPYINTLYKTTETDILHGTLMASQTLPFALSLILLPVYLMTLRIFNAVKKRYPKKIIYAIIIGSSYILFFSLLLLLNRIFYSNKRNSDNQVTIQIDNNQDTQFELTYSDTRVFSELIRRIKINSNYIPVYTKLSVSSAEKDVPPVLYSDNDYISPSTGTVCFIMPLYPPSQLEFSYGCGEEKQKITAELIYYSQAEGIYHSVVKTISAGGKE